MDSDILKHLKTLFNEFQVDGFNCSIFREQDCGNIYRIILDTKTGHWVYYTYWDQLFTSTEFRDVEWDSVQW